MTMLDTNNVIRCSDPLLAAVASKVQRGDRLSCEDGLVLYESPDLWSVLGLANLVRRRMHGNIAWYNVNRHLNYTNVCALSCHFCAFHRKRGDEGAYEYTIDEIREEARKAIAAGATELHVVGGLHPWHPFEFYTDMLRAIREEAPRLHIKAFTAVEVVHLARISKRGRDGAEGIRQVLLELKESGLDSLPGGGAEVFDERVHDEAFKDKIRGDAWMDVHRIAHELGIHTNATMLYGHLEGRMERLRHMELLRGQQDATLVPWADSQGIKTNNQQVVLTGPDACYPGMRVPTVDTCDTGYYQTVVPLPFIPDDSVLERLYGPTGLENMRTLAIARLMLDNIPHMKTFWIMQTLPASQLMLEMGGADDIDGTVVWYDITKVQGEGTHQEVTVSDLHRVMRESGLEPVERDTLYRPVTRNGDEWSVDEKPRSIHSL
ncbi:MAG: radical SAM protein [Phycisphaerales bacterium]|jgi:aminodeoxyfutalosine synthase|nr:radical SAM protein [Phycisphaerales bacterium]